VDKTLANWQFTITLLGQSLTLSKGLEGSEINPKPAATFGILQIYQNFLADQDCEPLSSFITKTVNIFTKNNITLHIECFNL